MRDSGERELPGLPNFSNTALSNHADLSFPVSFTASSISLAKSACTLNENTLLGCITFICKHRKQSYGSNPHSLM